MVVSGLGRWGVRPDAFLWAGRIVGGFRRLLEGVRLGWDGVDLPAARGTLFVQRTPFKTQRPLTTETNGLDQGVTIIFNPSQAHGVQQALDEISTVSAISKPSVLLVGRYRKNREALPPVRQQHR